MDHGTTLKAKNVTKYSFRIFFRPAIYQYDLEVYKTEAEAAFKSP